MARRQYDDDDGRTIADMNVDGMPWSGDRRGALRRIVSRRQEEDGGQAPDPDEQQLSKRETRSLIFGALLAALAIGAVFAVAAVLFILFCVYVWFK